MANIVFSQSRNIDPFSSFNSNNANALTRVVTLGNDVILSRDSFDVTPDSTSPNDTIIISTGHVVKDDVLIEMLDDFRVDMTDPDFYTESTAMDSTGYYYITLYYEYIKTKPPPEAKIRILKPDQRDDISLSGFMFLACVEVNESLEIENIYDYDPENRDVSRNYAQSGGGVNIVDSLPEWNLDLEGLIYYENSSGKFYAAGPDDWYEIKLDKYSTITSNHEAVGNEIIFVNTSTNSLTVTLPGLPYDGEQVSIIDIGRLFDDYPITIDGNGNDIIGKSTITSELNYSQYRFIFSETKGEWFYSQSATSVGTGRDTLSINSDYTPEVNQRLLVTDSTSDLTITFPASPEIGDVLEVIDDGRMFGTYPVTFDGNGKTISGSSTLMSNKDGSRYLFTFSSDSNEWKYTHTLEEQQVYAKLTPYQMSLDDTNVGSDGGNLFGIMETVDFASDEDGSIWSTLKYDTTQLNTNYPIYMNIHYSLNGDDPGTDVILETEYWTLDPSLSYDENSPDSTAVEDVIISDSTSDVNIGVYTEESLTVEIDPGYMNKDTQFIVIKFTRRGSSDTYSGTLQLVALELYQNI